MQVELLRKGFDLAGLDLGDVDHIVDEAEEMLAGTEDDGEVLLLLGIDRSDLQFPNQRSLANTGIAGNHYQLRSSALDNPVENTHQISNIVFPTV